MAIFRAMRDIAFQEPHQRTVLSKGTLVDIAIEDAAIEVAVLMGWLQPESPIFGSSLYPQDPKPAREDSLGTTRRHFFRVKPFQEGVLSSRTLFWSQYFFGLLRALVRPSLKRSLISFNSLSETFDLLLATVMSPSIHAYQS